MTGQSRNSGKALLGLVLQQEERRQAAGALVPSRRHGWSLKWVGVVGSIRGAA